MAHSRCPSPFCPMVSMQTLSTTRPVTVAGFPLGACAAAPVAITTTNAAASAPTPANALIAPPPVIVSLAHRKPGRRAGYSHRVAGSPDAAVDERAPGRDEERDKVGQRYLPRERRVRPPADDRVALVDGDEHGLHDERDPGGAAEERPTAKDAAQTQGRRALLRLQPEAAALAFVLSAGSASRASALRHAGRLFSGQTGRSAAGRSGTPSVWRSRRTGGSPRRRYPAGSGSSRASP